MGTEYDFIEKIDEIISFGYYLQHNCLVKLPFDLSDSPSKIIPIISDTALRIYNFLNKHEKITNAYYPETEHKHNGGLIFASEIKALLVCPEVKSGLDPLGLRQYLTYENSFGPTTMH